ncbi:MAG: hypothetical protein K8R11_00790 [Methanococcoides sp.]|nr:hypothetical protein [Methanococcoides sp.]
MKIKLARKNGTNHGILKRVTAKIVVMNDPYMIYDVFFVLIDFIKNNSSNGYINIPYKLYNGWGHSM